MTNSSYVYIYTEKDLQAVSALFYQVFTSPPWEYTWFTHEKIQTYLQDLANCPKALSFVLANNKEEKKIIGACMGSISDYFSSSQYDIKEFFIHPQLQSQGYGGSFLKAIEKELKKMDIEFIALYTQRNINAYDFYLKNGYDVMTDTVFMTKFL